MSSFRKIILFLVSVKLAFVKLESGEVNKIWTERGKKCPTWKWHTKVCENCLSEDGCEGGAHLILLCYKMD